MSSIKLADIATELEPIGWKVNSDKYKNLDAPLEFECSAGHRVYSTWRKIRSNPECPLCNKQALKEQQQRITKKKKGEYRILALDQASHICGWSVYSNKNLIAFGTFKTREDDEVARFHEVREWLAAMVENWEPDYVGIEGIQYQTNIGVTTFQTLARLQGVLLDYLYTERIPYKICPTNTWRTHCGVTGSTRSDKKRSIQLKIQEWYGLKLDEDAADAAGIGKYVADTVSPALEIESWI